MTALYDALTYLGRDVGLEEHRSSDLSSLGRMLDKYGVARAFVTAFASRRLDPLYGNEHVFRAAARDCRILPCAAVLPNACLEVGDEARQIAILIDRGARCACLYPAGYGTGLDRRVIGPLLAALEKRRLPLALFETDLSQAAAIARGFPRLPILLHRVPYRNRTWLPLLKDTPNLHVSLAPNFAPYRGLETIVKHCGADRLLFASGWPETEPGSPIGYLMYSGLRDRDVRKISWENLAGLIDAVRVTGRKAASKRPARMPSVAAAGLAGNVLSRRPLSLRGVTDMHGHYGQWHEFPVWGGEADDLVAEMDRAGIARFAVAHQACMTPEATWGNDQVLAAMARYPGRILGYATCYPVNARLGIQEIRRCLASGMIGIKLHSSNGFAYTHEGYRPVWKLADRRRLPVLLHTWGDMDNYRQIFERYRRAPILLGHSGAARKELYVEYARRYPNVYLELVYSMAPYGLVEYFVREVGAERILFGSDAPWMSFGSQLGRVAFADIRESEKKTILVDNPARLLALQRKATRQR